MSIDDELEKDEFFKQYYFKFSSPFRVDFDLHNNKYHSVRIFKDCYLYSYKLIFYDINNIAEYETMIEPERLCKTVKKEIQKYELCEEVKKEKESVINRIAGGKAIVILESEEDIKLVEEALSSRKLAKLVEEVKHDLTVEHHYGLGDIEDEKVKKIICSDDDFMAEWIKKMDGNDISYASDKIKDSEKIVFLALENSEIELIDYDIFSTPIYHASDRLKNDLKFAEKALKYYGLCMTDFSDVIKDCDRMVGFAIRQNPEAFLFISQRLKRNKEIIKLATKEGFNTIPHISKKLLKQNRNFMFGLLKLNECLIYDIKEYYDDKEIMEYAINKDSKNLKLASDRLKDDWDFVRDFIAKDPSCLSYTSERILEYFLHKIRNAYTFSLEKELPEFTLENIPKPL